MGIGFIHSFEHSEQGFPGSGAVINAEGPGSHPRGLTVHREGMDCGLESQARGKRDTAPDPSPGSLGHHIALVPQRPSKPPSCISSPARCCTFHVQMQTPALDSTESSRPSHPC